MVDKIFDFFGDVTKPAVASVSSASFGTIITIFDFSKPIIEIVLQNLSWLVAIIAGIMAIINSCYNLRDRKKKRNGRNNKKIKG